MRRPVLRIAEPACRTDAAGRQIYLWIRGQDPDEASPESGNRPKGAPHGAPFFLSGSWATARSKHFPYPGPIISALLPRRHPPPLQPDRIMQKNLQASDSVPTPDALANESEEQVLVLREDELEQVAGGRGSRAGFLMTE